MTLFLYALYSFVFSFLIQLVIIIICEIKNKRKQKCDENMKEQEGIAADNGLVILIAVFLWLTSLIVSIILAIIMFYGIVFATWIVLKDGR